MISIKRRMKEIKKHGLPFGIPKPTESQLEAIEEALYNVSDSNSTEVEYVVHLLQLLGLTDFEIV